MTHAARRESGSGVHHVTMRGAGRRRIFEDDRDRRYFVEGLRELVEKDRVELLAWCLMDNHVHMLAKADLLHLSKGLHRLATSYALFFNGRHGHVGPVFQDRFGSLPVETDEHLLMAMRYIHLNPLDLGAAFPGDYRWSSYGQYAGKPGLCDTSTVLDLLGGRGSFVEFCDPGHGREDLVSFSAKGPRISDAEAKHLAETCYGADFSDRLVALDKSERDRALRRLKARGLSIRQIERLTGIGRGIIMRA